tara:strand:+ start:13026 stop:16595 length:3570 start_codon:yes stop_codon:yes gene_type:complete
MLPCSIKYYRTIYLTVFITVGIAFSSIYAQNFDKEKLLEFSENFKSEQIKKKKGKEIQVQKNVVYFYSRFPVIYQSANIDGARAVKNDQLWSGGIAGLSLSGSDQILGYWDRKQPRLTHQEYTGRVSFVDSESGSDDAHATQMTGTMIATGVVADAHGMANEAEVEAYNWNSDIAEMATAAANGLLQSAHPYTETTGWTSTSSYCGNSLIWTWFSLESENETKAYQFGYYDSQAQNWDSVAYMAPNYLIIKAAGNFRGVGPETQPIKHFTLDSDFNCVEDSTSVRDINGGLTGFESVSGASVSKNILVVGAVESSSGNFKDLESISPIENSGFGPTDDGRVKPDIVAPTGLYTSTSLSNTSYSTSGGTSAATAVITGSVALLREHYQNLNDDTLSSASIRALLAQSADDIGNSGPDYKTGWGLLNTERAARFISSNASNTIQTVFLDTVLTDGSTIQFDYTNTSKNNLKLTIAWTDPKGEVPVSGDDPANIILVNDLDLRVTSPSAQTHFPWKLSRNNPESDATEADNEVDNIEQIYISTPETGSYTISISHKGTLQSGSQRVSVLVSETEPKVQIETIASGNWSSSSIWNESLVPNTTFHEAVINHQVSLDTGISISGIHFMNSISELILNGNEVTIYNGIESFSEKGFSGDSLAVLNIEGWNRDSLSFASGKRKLAQLVINTLNDTVQLSSDLSIYSKLDLQSGNLATNNVELKLISDTVNTALLQKSGGGLLGDLTYSRYFGNGGSGWRMISSPVEGGMYSSLNTSFFTQGGSWASNTADSVNSSLWTFDNTTQNFGSYIGSDDSFSSGEGYLFYMFEEDLEGSPMLSTFLKLRGQEPNSVITNLYRGVADSASYNFAGNPFAGTLDWHEIVNESENLATSYALWDPDASAYKYYNMSGEIGVAGRYIAPMQGFFVQSTNANGVLRFRQSQKTSGAPEKYGKSQSSIPVLSVHLSTENGELLDNQAQVVFSDQGSEYRDQFDVKRISAIGGKENNLSFFVGAERRVFEGRSMDAGIEKIPLLIDVEESGFYKLKWEERNIPDDWTFMLEDRVVGKRMDLSAQSEFNFFHNVDNTNSLMRFSIQAFKGIKTSLTEEISLPKEFGLSQNYPNPFNPHTIIEYQIPKRSNVRIEVFDILGRKVAVLIDEIKNPGFHSLVFNASNLASGTYFYRIKAGGFIRAKSFVLIK